MHTNDYFDALLNADHITVNYDEISNQLNPSGEPLDLLPAIAFQLSERIETPQHYARAQKIVTELARACLEFNLRESYNEHAEALLELETLPELTCKVTTTLY